MAVLQHMMQHQMRQPINKETDWSGICDSVFDQFVGDDVFGLATGQQRNSAGSDTTSGFFDFSSAQSNHTTGTSPDPAWAEHVAMMADAVESMPPVPYAHQPQAKESSSYWQKKLIAIERNAAESDDRQRRLRTVKSHPGFLSIGGNPSPPAAASYSACPVPDNSLSVPRSRPSESASSKKRSTSQHRSVSRGRPQGVTKSSTTANTPSSTMRKRSVSPTKMMTPSRYRAGFKDAWADKLQASPSKYALRLPHQSLPESPPSSGQLQQQDFAAFGSPAATTNASTAMLAAAAAVYDTELSPLTTTFGQARIHTPDASPFFAPAAQQAYPGHNAVAYQPAGFSTHTVPLNDVSPGHRIGSFDFGFSNASAHDSWSQQPVFEQSTMSEYHNAIAAPDLPLAESHGLLDTQQQYLTGLGISCDVPYHSAMQHFEYAPAAQIYEAVPMMPTRAVCYPPQDALPLTPRKQRITQSPSPPLTEPRSRRPSNFSQARRASKHRRARSSTSVPRHVQSDKGGFVNFTPDDSNKILSGVAPSGSSKTKARREKEAADRRRRLSQAAVKAVVDAGGDLESLAKAGLIM